MLATDTTLGGRYRLGSIIGRGGGAEVFRAEDLTTGRPVAVKVLRAVSPSDLQRFEQEGKTLARLDHPAIVRMCDDGDHEGVPYLVLDLVDGEPLSTRLHEGSMDEDAVARMGVVLADALAHAHDIGVVHRDVKPGNVLFDQDGGVHLTDFGIARLTDMTAITATGLVIGTAAYLAPEQVKGDGASPASDIYALGLVLLEALTGERAYDGSPLRGGGRTPAPLTGDPADAIACTRGATCSHDRVGADAPSVSRRGCPCPHARGAPPGSGCNRGAPDRERRHGRDPGAGAALPRD